MASDHESFRFVSTLFSEVNSCDSLFDLCQLLRNLRYPDKMGAKLLAHLKNTIRPFHDEILSDASQRKSFAMANFGLQIMPQPVLVHTFQYIGMKSLFRSMAVNKSLFQKTITLPRAICFVKPTIHIEYASADADECRGCSTFRHSNNGISFTIFSQDEDSEPVTDKLKIFTFFKNSRSLEVLLEGYIDVFADEWGISNHLFENATHLHFGTNANLDVFCETSRCLSNTTHITLWGHRVEWEASVFPNLTCLTLDNFIRLEPNPEIYPKIKELSLTISQFELYHDFGHEFAKNLQMFPSLKKLNIRVSRGGALGKWDRFLDSQGDGFEDSEDDRSEGYAPFDEYDDFNIDYIDDSWVTLGEVVGVTGFVESVQFEIVDVANEDDKNKIVQVLTKFLKCKGILKQMCG